MSGDISGSETLDSINKAFQKMENLENTISSLKYDLEMINSKMNLVNREKAYWLRKWFTANAHSVLLVEENRALWDCHLEDKYCLDYLSTSKIQLEEVVRNTRMENQRLNCLCEKTEQISSKLCLRLEDACPICLSAPEGNICILDCTHWFCQTCIDRWDAQRRSPVPWTHCPICKEWVRERVMIKPILRSNVSHSRPFGDPRAFSGIQAHGVEEVEGEEIVLRPRSEPPPSPT